MDGESWFPQSFCQTIQSVEYISAFPSYEHIIAWISELELMSNLKEVSFQTIPIQDLDPDPYQRGSAHSWILEANRDAVYQAIFTRLIKFSRTQHHLVNEVPFQHLQILQCTDIHNGRSPSRWKQIAYEAEECGWIWEQCKDGSGQAHAHIYRERLIKKHST